ncbi:hypothetical protein CXG81DRAFT_15314 [Caulochytrium protostelioides]|uniref:Flavocytochrome c n=1 Tax=Caulochytrium protostelioides TaxID=1555241 RepID=A0A4P9WX46_9FUNG|nr:Flavocytochrome c [Caulochytrium protostelioides]RKO98904.1 hypothetical protein CXG81DRAFT_15314 [Caulochytrium protostelioides]|eukprot:RKO98904.1 hypothetical protein CXG81DRAFT_15314 [Caulochytrium protostelioides]
MAQAPKVIVVGGGLTGLAAAHTLLERGVRVILLEKSPFLGGNSVKATSGMNAAGTMTQVKLGIPDNAAIFYDDSAKAAGDIITPALTRVLTYESKAALEWVQDTFHVDLSLVSRLGGHSQPRTHRGTEKFPGMTITYALMEALEKRAKNEPDRVQIRTKCRVRRLLQSGNGGGGQPVEGVEFTDDRHQTSHTVKGLVVLATGGYAADYEEDSILKQYRPDAYALPTTNGPHATGDGVKMTMRAGGETIHLDKVQIHPTGIVNPSEPDAKVKFLAAEALRGAGGILLDRHGRRFADELGNREYVSNQMKANQGPFRLVLNSKASDELDWHIKHYTGRGIMKHYDSGAALAKDMDIAPQALEATFKAYNAAAQKKTDEFGKKFFHNVPLEMCDTFSVCIVTYVTHFSMGGIKIDEHAQVLGPEGPIPGLYACGETAGGVHGAVRLGGSSLLGCCVFGRVAGASAASEFTRRLAAQRIDHVASHLSGSGDQPGTAQFGAAATAGDSGAPTSKKAPASEDLKTYTLEDVSRHAKDNWIVVNGQVLDVTSFLDDHPGGAKALLLYCGKDASEEFNMLHEKNVIQKYAPQTVIGVLKS